jgi:hypothetical protein
MAIELHRYRDSVDYSNEAPLLADLAHLRTQASGGTVQARTVLRTNVDRRRFMDKNYTLELPGSQPEARLYVHIPAKDIVEMLKDTALGKFQSLIIHPLEAAEILRRMRP